jgi:acyl-CoA hydrolase
MGDENAQLRFGGAPWINLFCTITATKVASVEIVTISLSLRVFMVYMDLLSWDGIANI